MITKLKELIDYKIAKKNSKYIECKNKKKNNLKKSLLKKKSKTKKR